jgi:hypothetical protein
MPGHPPQPDLQAPNLPLVIASVTLLSKRRFFWLSGVALGIVGLIISATGFGVH